MGCTPSAMNEVLLELRNVTVLRGGRRALDGVTLSIPRGQNTAVLGPNGAGKSTLLRMLNGEFFPVRRPGVPSVRPLTGARTGSRVARVRATRVRMRLLGRERWNVFDVRRQLGVVSHELQATHHGWLSGLDVVCSGFFASVGVYRHQGLTEAQRYRAEAAAASQGAVDLLERRFDTLSSGEQRRLLLARALVHEPHTLLLDEPATGLDLRAAFGLMERLRNLAAAGTTLIIVTHHVDQIPPEVERVVLLKAGRVFADGSKDEVLTGPTLSELFEVDVQVVERDGYFQVLPG